MARYFSGITLSRDKYAISIIDDNLNIIFMDRLEIDKLIDLLKKKSVTVVSVDAPLALYLRYSRTIHDNESNTPINIKKRYFDCTLASRRLFTYNDRFNDVNKESIKMFLELLNQLNKLGFSIRRPEEKEKAIIESHMDTSLALLGYSHSFKTFDEESLRKKIEALRNKGLRMKDYFRRNLKDCNFGINTLCQAYTSYVYYSGEVTCFGNPEQGLLVIPGKLPAEKSSPVKAADKIYRHENRPENSQSPSSRIKLGGANVMTEYCGAQYLYTNTDGVIRVNDLRPIKSYRPFTEIYEIKYIKSVQVTINTTDGLRKVKANLIPSFESISSFRAAEEEDKRKLDSFWGNNGDKRGYLIRFNKVEIVKA